MALLGSLSSFTNSLAWGFNFLWGVFIASLVKLIYRFLRKKKIIKRKYINNYQMDRISGFSFDLMIVAGVSAIEINDIKKYLLLIIVLCVVGAIGTYAFIRIVTKHCFKGYEHQMFVANFATVTGTASNGMILLKEIDPNFETPTSDLFVLSQFPAMIFVCPLLLILNFASASLTHAFIALGIFTILFIAYFIFLMRKAIFKKKHK
jgi:ESS family glutamate:Na+ symporter